MINFICASAGRGKTLLMQKILENKEKFLISTFDFYKDEYNFQLEEIKLNSFSQIKNNLKLNNNKIIFTTNNQNNLKMNFPYFLRTLMKTKKFNEYTIVLENSFFYIDQNLFNLLFHISRYTDIYILVHSTKDFEDLIRNREYLFNFYFNSKDIYFEPMNSFLEKNIQINTENLFDKIKEFNNSLRYGVFIEISQGKYKILKDMK